MDGQDNVCWNVISMKCKTVDSQKQGSKFTSEDTKRSSQFSNSVQSKDKKRQVPPVNY